MATKDKSIYIPTGFESEQRAAERKRKIAQAMMERGLTTNPNMQSWTQVLGQMGAAFAGKRMDKKADLMDDATDAKILAKRDEDLTAYSAAEDALDPKSSDYDKQVRALRTTAAKSPFLEDEREMLGKAVGKRIESQGERINFGGQWRQAGGIADNEFEPNKPTDAVIRGGPDGRTFVPNEAAISSALARQPNVDINPGAISQVGGLTSRDPMAPPVPGPAQPAQPAAPAGDEAAMVFQQLDPKEREIVGGILKKYSAQGAAANVPSGSPLGPTGTKPPDGTTIDGKPIWYVNGVPYDNPEGK